MKKSMWRFLPLIMFLILGLFLGRGLLLDPQKLPSVRLGKALPEFNLPDLNHPGKYITAEAFKGHVVLLNVWASWCPACINEQVFMMELARQGVLIYGVNYKDQAQDALRWLTEWGNPYQKIVQDEQGRLAIDLGVYGAPETFIIDKKGIIQYRHAGILNKELWVNEVRPLMHELEQKG